MKYDFTTIYDRRGMDAAAVDSVGTRIWGIEPAAPKEGFDFISMWVADMNFATCPAVTDAIIKRAEHPLFGYFNYSEEYYQAIITWRQAGGFHAGLAPEHIGYENGVHGFLSSAVQVLTEPGDAILLHSPVYVGFREDVEGLGRRSVYSPLVQDHAGVYRMDYADMERKIRENEIKLAIFCSPHNPSGRVWERQELERALEVFERCGVTVLADEIWADMIFPGNKHIPLQSVNAWAREHVCAAYAPSKTFNLAGLIGSYHIIYNEELRRKITVHGLNTHYNGMNVLSMHALIGGYSAAGREWLHELMQVIQSNAAYAVAFIRDHFPGIQVQMPEGTYMLFLNLTGYCAASGRSLDEVLHAGWDVGIGWQDGRPFEGPSHIRLNLASPRPQIEKAFERMKEYVFLRSL